MRTLLTYVLLVLFMTGLWLFVRGIVHDSDPMGLAGSAILGLVMTSVFRKVTGVDR